MGICGAMYTYIVILHITRLIPTCVLSISIYVYLSPIYIYYLYPSIHPPTYPLISHISTYPSIYPFAYLLSIYLPTYLSIIYHLWCIIYLHTLYPSRHRSIWRRRDKVRDTRVHPIPLSYQTRSRGLLRLKLGNWQKKVKSSQIALEPRVESRDGNLASLNNARFPHLSHA